MGRSRPPCRLHENTEKLKVCTYCNCVNKQITNGDSILCKRVTLTQGDIFDLMCLFVKQRERVQDERKKEMMIYDFNNCTVQVVQFDCLVVFLFSGRLSLIFVQKWLFTMIQVSVSVKSRDWSRGLGGRGLLGWCSTTEYSWPEY